ncbi:Hypothetical protein A7982_12567 [Minicystis rosea]|nr:Hypothetical protein A7982_12567 [Minicystis rosea]
MKQLGLFSDAAPRPLPSFEAEERLAAQLPAWIHPGPSTWTFPGWEGIVYPTGVTKEELVDHGLGWAARFPLFRTVGIDRSYYAPIEEADLARYAKDLPAGYPCVMKAWSAVTTLSDPRTGAPNPRFFDAAALEQHVLRPVARVFRDHAGPIVLQMAPIHPRDLPHPDAFAERLDRFLGALPTALPYAVELRNRELLTGTYLDVLARHGVAHVLNLWERMPTIGRQLAIPNVLTAPFVVCRLSIPPGQRYEEQKAAFAPFNRIVKADETVRLDMAAVARACGERRKKLFFVVNNKVEGSSPLTVRALIEHMIAGLGPSSP